jgi:hypothetical protein
MAAPSTAFAASAPVVGSLGGIAFKACSRTARTPNAVARRMLTTAGLFDNFEMPFANPFAARDADDGVPRAYGFEVDYAYLANPLKGTGEDAFFVESGCCGVFDGVSGAADTQGVDPRLFSQKMAALTSRKVRQYGPSSVVKAVYEAAELNDQIGACTACVIGMDNTGRVYGVNLGDSGVLIIRDGKKIFKTKEQQHQFNCPFQLSSVTNTDTMAMGQVSLVPTLSN